MRDPWVYSLNISVVLCWLQVILKRPVGCKDGLAPEERIAGFNEESVNVLWNKIFGLLANNVIKVVLRQTVANVVAGGESEGDELLIPRWVFWVAPLPQLRLIVDALAWCHDEVEWSTSGESAEVEYLLVDHHEMRLKRRFVK